MLYKATIRTVSPLERRWGEEVSTVIGEVLVVIATMEPPRVAVVDAPPSSIVTWRIETSPNLFGWRVTKLCTLSSGLGLQPTYRRGEVTKEATCVSSCSTRIHIPSLPAVDKGTVEEQYDKRTRYSILFPAEGDRRSSEGRVDLGIIQWWYKEDDEKEDDEKEDDEKNDEKEDGDKPDDDRKDDDDKQDDDKQDDDKQDDDKQDGDKQDV